MKKLDINSIGNTLLKVDGKIVFKLQEMLDKRNITRYRLHVLTGIRYDTVCNYAKGEVMLINVEYLKIFCDVLDCKIEDIMEYKK